MKFKQAQIMKLDRVDPTDEEVEMYRENHRLRMLRIQERFMAREEEEGTGSAEATADNNHVKDYKEEEELLANSKPETISLFQKVNKGPSFAAETSLDDDLVLEDLDEEEDLTGGNAPQPSRQMLLVRKTANDKAQETSLVNKLISGLMTDSSNNNKIH